MKNMSRRRFMHSAAAGTGALAAASLVSSVSTAAAKISPEDRVKLGKAGVEVSRMAVGSGTVGWNKSSNQTKLGMEGFTSLIRHGFDRGLTFWDSADQYGSHPYFANALKSVPREKVGILTKSTSRDAAGMKADIERFRKELKSDYIDILLLHCLIEENWPETMQATLDVVSEAKEAGKVRVCGCSCHSLAALSKAAEHPWVEVILTRINHAGSRMDGAPDEVVPVLRKAKENGKSLIGMKIVGQGDLKGEIDTSLTFMKGLGIIDAFTIGFESAKEMDDMITRVSKA